MIRKSKTMLSLRGAHRGFPPENAEQPEIERAQTVSDVMTLVVTSERDEMTLRQAAESLADQLLTLPSVTLVSLMGARDLEISAEVSEQTLREFNLSIADLAPAINASLNLSAGNCEPMPATCYCEPIKSA